jgi:hypothetical protein
MAALCAGAFCFIPALANQRPPATHPRPCSAPHSGKVPLVGFVNPKVVSEMLGHSMVVIASDVCSHALPDMQRDTATLELLL